ncbi:MAG: hypothetical protein B6U86_04865 [Candidatus Altiarchaeales archaeon ex4484_43]|nr:MAG: hypothetical protein B6U86_04865 [Candidatus Altiarchaeales archaeon ex4484_43]
MSKNKSISISAFVIVMIFLITPSYAQTSPRDEDINLTWTYSVNDDITALTPGKMNNDSVVIIASGKNLYILNKDGNLTEQYTIQTPGKIYVVRIADIDEDDESEILLGLGWMETEEIDLNKAYPPPDGIPEEKDLLYKVLKNKGSFYVIDNGKINKWDGTDQWVRSIIVSDINGDDEDEVIIVSGGYTNNYFKKYTNIVYRHRYCWIEWDIDHTGYSESDCTCDGCFWDNSTERCLINKTWEECGWNETTGKGWNFSESSSVNGSIIIFDRLGDLLLKSNMTVSREFWSADVSNLYHDRDEEIIVGSGNRIYIFTSNGSMHASYDVLGDINNIYTSDINNDENDDIIFSFRNSSSGISGIEVINREGRQLWEYRMKPESSISAMYMKTLDKDAINEVLLVSDDILHVIDDRGQLSWSYQFKYNNNKLILRDINKIFSIDLDDDGYENLIVASNGVVYNYEIIGTFIEKQSADKYYALGKEAYELDRYQEAKKYLERAKQLYLELNHSDGASECDSLLEDINEKLTGNRRVEADSKYAKALTYYSVRDYESAKKYLQNARDIYTEIGDSDGILRCDSLMSKIEEILLKKSSTTTTSIITTTTTLPKEFDILSLLSNPATIVGFVAIILVIFAILGRHRALMPKEEKGRKKEKREPEEEGLTGNWKTLEEQWKKLEEP